MSYLHAPRLVFTGDFLSDVSTVNNDTAHYNNETFKPDFQKPGQGATNGWWNPEGGAVFDFQNCRIRQLSLPDGTILSHPSQDPLIGQVVMGAEGRPTGKMVDIDPDAQMYSALWCVQVRICTRDNELLLQGDLDTTSFRDIQMRQTDGAKNNGQALGATWTSTLTNVQWGEKANWSPFLGRLRKTTQENKLSVNLNSFGYYYAHNDGRFSLGRILGSIGPYFSNEPVTFAAARRLYGIYQPAGQRSTYFSTSNFLVEYETNSVTVDLGASFPVENSLGAIHLNQRLYLAVSKIPVQFAPDRNNPAYYISQSDVVGIGIVGYASGNDWLMQTGGVVSLNNLPSETMRLLTDHQLLLITMVQGKPDQFLVVAREAIDGQVVRADNFVLRLDCRETQKVKFHAYQWGRPLANALIKTSLQPPTPDTPVGPNNPISVIYGNNFPQDGITFASSVVTAADGTAELQLTGNPIHSPRHYIDGQIYTFDYQLDEVDPAFGTENIVVHLRDEFETIENPVWSDIVSIMTQYGNLYPVMSKYIASFADPVALIEKKDIFIFAFSRPLENTMHMPVTRDLSEGKRQTILNWLHHPVTDDKGTSSHLQAVAKPENPVPENTPLTDNQKKYKEAVRAKNGAVAEFQVIGNLFEN